MYVLIPIFFNVEVKNDFDSTKSFPIKFEIQDITDTARLSWYRVVAIYKSNHDIGTTYLILNIHRVSIYINTHMIFHQSKKQ
jgi:hypothetical protein